MRIKVIGVERAAEYVMGDVLNIWSEFTNKRVVKCKVCGREIAKGGGIGAYFYPALVSCRHYSLRQSCNCGWVISHVFVCKVCDPIISKLVWW